MGHSDHVSQLKLIYMKFKSESIFLLDGATGSELDRAGVNVGMPLWSAHAILEAPEILKQVHISYLEAGAQAIVTNTFRTHERSLAKAGMGDRAEELTTKAVEIARSARDEVNTDARIFGSVAPLEDCYSPELVPSAESCEIEQQQIMGHLHGAGVDLVLFETICSAREAIAIAKIAKEAWAISFCLQTNELGKLLDGTSVSNIIQQFEDAKFIGINCYPANSLAQQVTCLRSVVPDHVPIAAYGNVGYANDEGGWVRTEAVEPERYAAYAKDWVNTGANIIGGCCGTTPATITAIHQLLCNTVSD